MENHHAINGKSTISMAIFNSKLLINGTRKNKSRKSQLPAGNQTWQLEIHCK